MFVPPENANGTAGAMELERPDTPPTNGTLAHNRLLPAPPTPSAALPPPDDRPVLAAFCYDEPDGATTRFVANIAGPLAARRVALHVFTRKPLDLGPAAATVHVLGE